jgi:hypothetical protein
MKDGVYRMGMVPLAASGPAFMGVVIAAAVLLLIWLLRSDSGAAGEQEPGADQRTVTRQRSE